MKYIEIYIRWKSFGLSSMGQRDRHTRTGARPPDPTILGTCHPVIPPAAAAAPSTLMTTLT